MVLTPTSIAIKYADIALTPASITTKYAGPNNGHNAMNIFF